VCMAGGPEVKIGFFPMQVLSLLQSIVPYRTVRKWCLTGEPFSAAEAKEGGLLSYVVPALELDSMTQRLIDRLAGKSPTAIRRGKYAMRAVGSMSFDEGIAYTEGQIALLVMTEDAKEGLASFNEERRPIWSGC
jgi:methylglutaconyl-CoA hydratase